DGGGFKKATATIDGASVLLVAPEVKNPVAVRFAWAMLAEPNLMNSAGLPASAFRSGTVPVRDSISQNVPEVKNYKLVYDLDLSGGNIEFWPNNYAEGNSANVPNASSETFDFGDTPTDPIDGFGCMQIHNHDVKQTLFAINHWREGEHADLGIGNAPTANPDWTFAANGDTYTNKRLRVFVRTK